jgi:hypothetical protein
MPLVPESGPLRVNAAEVLVTAWVETNRGRYTSVLHDPPVFAIPTLD